MIKHVKGDIFQSDADVILHQVNCQGVMGSGIARQVRIMYPNVYNEYWRFCMSNADRRKGMLGIAQFVIVAPNRYIVNLFAQEYYGRGGKCYTDYEALRQCLHRVNSNFRGQMVAIPYLMGCDRGGGNWDIVYKIIKETLTDCDVVLYEYNG